MSSIVCMVNNIRLRHGPCPWSRYLAGRFCGEASVAKMAGRKIWRRRYRRKWREEEGDERAKVHLPLHLPPSTPTIDDDHEIQLTPYPYVPRSPPNTQTHTEKRTAITTTELNKDEAIPLFSANRLLLLRRWSIDIATLPPLGPTTSSGVTATTTTTI